MKKIFIILTLLLTLNIFGCENDTSDSGNDLSPDNSTHSSESSNESDISDDEDAIAQIYKFLTSEYTVTATRESFGTLYTTEYYFVKGIVAGVRLTTELNEQSDADEYYELIIEDFPDSTIEDTIVTQYMEDNHIYYGYTLDKLKFMLQKSGYEYTLNFDEEAFNEQFTVSKPD